MHAPMSKCTAFLWRMILFFGEVFSITSSKPKNKEMLTDLKRGDTSSYEMWLRPQWYSTPSDPYYLPLKRLDPYYLSLKWMYLDSYQLSLKRMYQVIWIGGTTCFG